MWNCMIIVLIRAFFLGLSNEQEEIIDNFNERSRYNAIEFNYDNPGGSEFQSNPNNCKELEDSSNDSPYICPPNLKLLPGMILPATERVAAIIEQTAKFVADKGSQLEILIKTKQANNPKFEFLNIDHKLHPFYRHITHLIKTAQFVPSKRHMSHLIEASADESRSITPTPSSNISSPSYPVAPKIDISSTPYGKLIERFKISQQNKETKSVTTQLTKHNNPGKPDKSSAIDLDLDIDSARQDKSPSPTGTAELNEARNKMYEYLYQQYYPYYYQYCHDSSGDSNQLTTEQLVEMARSYAASSAASWIESNMPHANQSNTVANGNDNQQPPIYESEPSSTILKMAEHVARNGQQFEQMMIARNLERFAFLMPGHRDHDKYRRALDKEISRLELHQKREIRLVSASPSPEPVLPEQTIASIAESYDLSPPPASGPISFKMSSKRRSGVSTQLNGFTDSFSFSDDMDDDFDFTDKLQVHKSEHVSSQSRVTKSGRISRFSPANPKNAMVMATLKNDLQIQRKRKAAEFLASRMLQDKIGKSDEPVNTSQKSL